MTQFTSSTVLIGSSLAIWKVKTYLRKVAMTDSHVLITGETGTGKELADGGTVLFDEIGDMSPYAQAKILRVIETKEVYPLGGRRSVPLDVRIIAATNRNLDQRMASNEFRQDLYFRLNVARVHLLPLSERKEDIPLLTDHFVQKFSAQFGRGIEGFSEEAMELLLRYDWPGNIRELINLIERIFIDPPREKISVADLPKSMQNRSPVHQETAPTEREILLYTLSQTNWSKSKAAERLHWSRMTLYRKIAKYHIVPSNPEATETPVEPANSCNNFPVSVTKV